MIRTLRRWGRAIREALTIDFLQLLKMVPGASDEMEQSPFRILLYRLGRILADRIPKILKSLAGMAITIFVVSAVFANLFKPYFPDRTFDELWGDSVTNASTLLDTGITRETQDKIETDADFRSLFFIEGILGLVINAVWFAWLVAAFVDPVNPIWLAPRAVIDTQKPGNPKLEFRYWIRYSEKNWLHRVVVTLRVQSDDADRDLIKDIAVLYENEQQRVMRRGVVRYSIDLRQAPDLVESLYKIALVQLYKDATEQESFMVDPRLDNALKTVMEGKPILVWSAKGGRPIEFDFTSKNPERDDIFRHQLQFRVAGSSESQEMCVEKKYSIEDILFGRSLMDAEIEDPDAAKLFEDTPEDRHRTHYGYRYQNAWKTRASGSSADDVMTMTKEVNESGDPNWYRNNLVDLCIFLGELNDERVRAYEKAHEISVRRESKPGSPREYEYKAYKAHAGEAEVSRVTFSVLGWDSVPSTVKQLGFDSTMGGEVIVVTGMETEEPYRRLGIMKRLLSYGETEGFNRGARYFVAEVASTALEAIGLLEQSGYEQLSSCEGTLCYVKMVANESVGLMPIIRDYFRSKMQQGE